MYRKEKSQSFEISTREVLYMTYLVAFLILPTFSSLPNCTLDLQSMTNVIAGIVSFFWGHDNNMYMFRPVKGLFRVKHHDSSGVMRCEWSLFLKRNECERCSVICTLNSIPSLVSRDTLGKNWL